PRSSSDPEETALSIAYVALALREARRFFLSSQNESYGSDRIRWSMNLGIPSAGYDDSVIRRRFEEIAQAGWLLSSRSTTPTLETAIEALQSAFVRSP